MPWPGKQSKNIAFNICLFVGEIEGPGFCTSCRMISPKDTWRQQHRLLQLLVEHILKGIPNMIFYTNMLLDRTSVGHELGRRCREYHCLVFEHKTNSLQLAPWLTTGAMALQAHVVVDQHLARETAVRPSTSEGPNRRSQHQMSCPEPILGPKTEGLE